MLIAVFVAVMFIGLGVYSGMTYVHEEGLLYDDDDDD
jgi:hypothetical protein